MWSHSSNSLAIWMTDLLPRVVRLIFWTVVAFTCGAIFRFDGFYYLVVACFLATFSIIEENGTDDYRDRGDHFS
jgi:hypothetical protein